MSFFAKLFGKKEDEVKVTETVNLPMLTEIDTRYVQKGLTKEVSAEEKELVSVIASSIMAGNQPDTEFRVKRILKIDEEKKLAVAITSAIAANDAPNSQFVLKKIEVIE